MPRYFVVKTRQGYLKSSFDKFTDDVNQAKRYAIGSLKNAWTGPGRSILNARNVELLEVVTVITPAADALKEVRAHLRAKRALAQARRKKR